MLDSQNKPPSLTSEMRMQSMDRGVNRKWVWLIAVIGLVLILIIGGLYWHSQSQLSKAKKELLQQQNDPATKLKEENKQLTEKIGKLIILPSNEEPTIATVSDLNKLKDQPFFAKAALGDKVLIYSTAKKAILYRPSSNQIIELAPLLDGTNTPSAPATSPTSTP